MRARTLLPPFFPPSLSLPGALRQAHDGVEVAPRGAVLVRQLAELAAHALGLDLLVELDQLAVGEVLVGLLLLGRLGGLRRRCGGGRGRGALEVERGINSQTLKERGRGKKGRESKKVDYWVDFGSWNSS